MLQRFPPGWRLTNIVKLDEYSELIVNFVDKFISTI